MEAKIIQTVQKYFLEAKSKNPGYSLRQFSKKINVPSPILSNVFRGKRTVTRQLAEKLLIHLDLSENERRTLIEGLPSKRGRSDTTKMPSILRELSHSEIAVLSDWWNFAILRLIEAESIRFGDTVKIANALSITPAKVTESMRNLTRLGLIELKGRQFKTVDRALSTTNAVASAAICKNDSQGFELARDAVFSVSQIGRAHV